MGKFEPKIKSDVAAMVKEAAGQQPDLIIDGEVIDQQFRNYIRKIAVDTIEGFNITPE
jgi:hypothetical protein